MSWETQGRQYHQWFGHGGGDGAGVDGGGGVVGAVLAAVGAAMPGGGGASWAKYAAGRGVKEFGDALPIWAGASGLDAAAFRRLVVGPVLSAGTAAAIQGVGAAVRAGGSVEALPQASAGLGAALAGEGGSWRRGLNYARNQAVYSAANGTTPAGLEGLKVSWQDSPLIRGLQTIGEAPLAFIPGTAQNEALTKAEEKVLRQLGILGGSSNGEATPPAPGAVLESKPKEERFRRRIEVDDGSDETGAPGRQPPPGGPKETAPPGLRRLSEDEILEQAQRRDYRSGEEWKARGLQIRADVDIAKDADGELYTIPRLGSGHAEPLYDTVRQ